MDNYTQPMFSVGGGGPRFAALELPSTDTIPSWFTIVFAAINGGGFCLNTLSLWLLATRKIVYKFKVNAFIVSLCVSDFLVSLSGFYFLGTITSTSGTLFSRRVATIIFGFSLETSLMSLCNLSYERLTAIRKPFHYHEILSTGKIVCISVFGWSFCISLLAVQFIFGFIYQHHKYVYFNWIVFISLALVSMAFLAIVYVYLICEIKRHSSHIRSVSIAKDSHGKHDYYHGSDVSNNACDTLTEVTYASDSSATTRAIDKNSDFLSHLSDNRSLLGIPKSASHDMDLRKAAIEKSRTNQKRSGEKRRLSARAYLLRKERRSVLFCLSIVVLFVATWMPVIVFFIRCLINNTCENDDQLLFICSCLVSINSLLDPILYFIITKDFRNFLCGKVCRNTSRRGSYESRRSSSANYI
ncbi:alpha-2 adrenergic receptor-like [Clytia hemisphaerica]|uniref:G-protein coupled receptors family 1 profile domain-containing protein n=1 Tax=Clytia hemisphaerica TaxID=252671 RepID=A0A7M5WK86_9CNID